MPSEYDVRLDVDAKGNFTIDPTTLCLTPKAAKRASGTPREWKDVGDNPLEVKWTCHNGPFVVQFNEHSPLADIEIHGTRVGDKVWEGTTEVNRQAPGGIYVYAVAIHDKDADTVFVHTSGEGKKWP